MKHTSLRSALALALTLILAACSTTPEPPADASKVTPQPVVRAQWFWQGAWWERNGTLTAETRGFFQSPQNAWVSQQATQLHANLTGANLTLDFNRAQQYWSPNRGVQYVSIPFEGVPGTGIVVQIKPTYFWFGEHTLTLLGVEYTRFEKIGANASVTTLANLSVASAYTASHQRAYSKLSLELNANGTYSEALLITVDGQTNAVLNTVGARGAVNQNQLNRLRTTGFSSLNVNPCARPSAPPRCQIQDAPSRYRNIIGTWLDISGNEVPQDSSAVPDSNEPLIAQRPDCQSLASQVANNREDENSIRSQFAAAATGAAFACGTAGWFVFTNPVADVACALAAWQAQTLQDDLKIRIRRTQEAVSAYNRLCPTK